jgi:NAD-dependent deacetylase
VSEADAGGDQTAPATSEPPGEDIARLAELIRSCQPVVALTGAGISVPSGIPDFRTPLTGLWANVDPMEVAHIAVWQRNPARFWDFYGQRFAALDGKQPNGAHLALAELERRGLLAGVITQNIDGLHAAAGTRDPIEVHGSIRTASCLSCGMRVSLAETRDRLSADEEGVPRCDCGRPFKPDVVLFGEMLPVDAMERAQALADGAGLMLVVGSSLEVYPVAGLPADTLARGGRLAIVTRSATPYDREASVKLSGDVVDELAAVVAALL